MTPAYQVDDGVLARRVPWLPIKRLPALSGCLFKGNPQFGAILPVRHFGVIAVADFQTQHWSTRVVEMPKLEV